LKETNEALEYEVNNLRKENQRLQRIIGDMESSISNLQDMEETLKDIKEMESTGLDDLEEQLEESKDILESLEVSIRGTILQNIMSIIFAVDKDGDYNLDDEEIDMLIKKIESINGINVNDELCKKKIIKLGRNIDSVMELVREVLEEEPNSKPPEERIITFLDDDGLN